MKSWILFLVACAIGIAGCEYEEYTVEMKVKKEGGFERSIEVKKGGLPAQRGDDTRVEEKPLAEFSRSPQIRTLYKKSVKTTPETQTASGVFRETIPDDVGNYGVLYTFPSRAGRLVIYAEQFRGTADPAGDVMEMFKWIDTRVDLLIAWFDLEYTGETQWPAFRAYLDKAYRRDLKNVLMYTWINTDHPQGEASFPARTMMDIGLYLIRRGYLKKDELLGRLGQANPDGADKVDSDNQRKLYYDILFRQAGVKSETFQQRMIQLLSDPKMRQTSLKKHGPTLLKSKVTDKETLRQIASDPGLGEALVLHKALEWSVEAFDPGGIRPKVNVAVGGLGKPVYTNGQWDEKQGKVTWRHTLRMDAKGPWKALPSRCYAVWLTADEKMQERIFVAPLDSETLAQYSLWRSQLNKKQTAVYEAHLDAVARAKDKAALWEAFFAAHPSRRFGYLKELLKPEPESESQAEEQE